MDTIIPFKNISLVEIIRGVVLWIVWLERNRLYFKTGTPRSIRAIGIQILSFVTFWCKNIDESFFVNIKHLLLQDVLLLYLHVGTLRMDQEEMGQRAGPKSELETDLLELWF
jgi:hypothetical protein